MYAAWSVYFATLVLSILSLIACMRLSVRSCRRPDDPRRLLGLVVAIAAGALVVFSPLDELSDRFFSAHMIEHELLLFSMPLALLAARPLPVAIVTPWRLAPTAWRRLFGRGWNRWRKSCALLSVFGRPLSALALSTLVLWLWHTPYLYDLALENEWLHTLEHVSFLATALLYWRPLLTAGHFTRLNSNVKRAFYLMAGGMQGGLLGALIALHSRVIYLGYLGQPGASAQSVLTDQQIGGAIMWFSGPFFFGVIASLVME